MMNKKYKLLAVVMALLLVFASGPIHIYASTTPVGTDVIVENNAGLTDKVTVNNLLPGDLVKVYVTTYSPTEIPKVTGTVGVGGNSIILSYAQLDPNDDGENIYITVTSTGSTESTPLMVALTPPGNSARLDPTQVKINNNAGIPDSLEVTNVSGGAVLTNGDIVKVYTGPSGNAIGVGYFSDSTGKAVISLAQLLNPTAGGSIFVSLTEMGLKESGRVEVSYNKETASGALDVAQVTITNNANIPDVVKVTGLLDGDTIKVYKDAASNVPMGSAKAVKQSDATYAALISVTIGGTGAGTLAVSLTNSGKLEGPKTTFPYVAAPKSNALDPAYITIKNLSVLKDTITVTNIGPGDIIRVYRLGSNVPLGSATVSAGKTDATVNISQLGVEAGIIYVTYNKLGFTESDAVDKTYPGEVQSDAPLATNIDVVNNFELPDIIKISGLAVGDTVKLYTLATGEIPFASSTVPTGKTEVSLTTAQLGAAAGSFFATLTSSGELESTKAEKTYAAEAKSSSATDITISNNTGKADVILVKGLLSSDRVSIYLTDTITTPLGSSVVPNGSTSMALSVSQLGVDAGSIYVSVKSTGKMESARTMADYIAELITNNSGVTISVKNYANMPDIVTVSGIAQGQVVRVYADQTAATPLVSGVATKSTYDLLYNQLGVAAGDVWVSVTSLGSRESARIQQSFTAETVSTALAVSDVTIVNHTGSPDTIQVKATANGYVYVYRDATTKLPMIRGLVPPNGILMLTYGNLGDAAGDVYISVANKTESESAKTAVHYNGALVSTPPIGGVPPTSNISIVNNSGRPDTITVTNLLPNDIIRVYKDNNLLTRSILAQSVFPVNGNTCLISVPQIGQATGSVYVSVQSVDMLESTRTQIGYVAEKDSTPAVAGNVTIVNNPGPDFILVSGLKSNDVVRIYSLGSNPIMLGTATVTPNTTYATFIVKQLGVGGGSINVTVTNTNCMESTKTSVTFTAE